MMVSMDFIKNPAIKAIQALTAKFLYLFLSKTSQEGIWATKNIPINPSKPQNKKYWIKVLNLLFQDPINQ